MKFIPAIFAFLLMSSSISAQAFRVIGYLPDHRLERYEQFDFNKLTHLFIAFVNPDTSGAFVMESGNTDLLKRTLIRARGFGLKTYLSIAGGGISGDLNKIWWRWTTKEKRGQLISNLMKWVDEYEFDGVDVDLEWDTVNQDYSPFVLALKDSLQTRQKQMTAALPATTRYTHITNEALQSFEFINIMAYDATGGWQPDKPGPHSSYEFAEQSIAYWLQQGVLAENLNLGVPFYGYNFATRPVEANTFHELVSRDSFNAYLDKTRDVYYNGIPTIRAKTLLAKKKVGGIMIWEIGQDTADYLKRYSLLKVIDETLKTPIPTTEISAVSVYPNPASDLVYVESPLLPKASVIILDILGREMFKSQVLDHHRCVMNVRHLPSGMYIVRIVGETETMTKTFVRK